MNTEENTIKSALTNYGMHIFNPNNTETSTVVIVGVERSGTSMVANVLQSLGVYLGDRCGDSVFEDISIFSSLENDRIDVFKKIVQNNNQKYNVWGWKRPKSYTYADKYCNIVRNIKFIVIFRDIFSIALRNQISVFSEIKQNLVETADKYKNLAKFVKTCKFPCLCVSYEKALYNKSAFVENLISYLQITPTAEQKEKTLSVISNGPVKYLVKSRFKEYQGEIEEINNEYIKGWCKEKFDNIPIALQVKCDGILVDNINSNLFRDDLKYKGNYGFLYKFKNNYNLNKVTVQVKNGSFALKLNNEAILKIIRNKILQIQPKVFLISGKPRSGKSSFAYSFKRKYKEKCSVITLEDFLIKKNIISIIPEKFKTDTVNGCVPNVYKYVNSKSFDIQTITFDFSIFLRKYLLNNNHNYIVIEGYPLKKLRKNIILIFESYGINLFTEMKTHKFKVYRNKQVFITNKLSSNGKGISPLYIGDKILYPGLYDEVVSKVTW